MDMCTWVESYIMEETYDMVFFKISELVLSQDKELWKALESITYLDFPQIGLPAHVHDGRKRVERATARFEKIGSFRTPLEKLECLLQTLKELSDPELFIGTDALVPLFLMTLIKSKVPHLMANFVYIRDYNFERNMTSGRYGYSLSTFEGLLDYVLYSSIPELSHQNQTLWSSVKAGELVSFTTHYCARTFDPRDREGNNALLMACLYGQTEIIEYILKHQGGVKETDLNDLNMTPLMCAIQSKSRSAVSLLLQDSYVLSRLRQIDRRGDSAFMYICATQDILLLKQLSACIDPLTFRNPWTGDSVLHRACQHNCPFEFTLYLIDLNLEKLKNKKNQSFYHLCRDQKLIQHLYTQKRIDITRLFLETDSLGQCALMTWADQGRLDLIELFSDDLSHQSIHYADKNGRTLLHLLAMRSKLVMGDKSLDFMVEKFKYLVHARDWPESNTALHIAVRNGHLPLIKALYRHGAKLDVVNFRGERPISDTLSVCHFLDELMLKTKTFAAKKCGYSWSVTRASIQHLKNSNFRIDFNIISEERGRRETIKSVKRGLQDFLFLRKELLYEIPELVLPTLNDMTEPPINEPLLINALLQRLQYFMAWIESHPILHYHDLVATFVRSSCWEPAVIRDHSFSRRRLLEEKLHTFSWGVNSTEEEYFFSYIQDTMSLLQDNYLKVLNAGRMVDNASQDLQVEQLAITTSFKAVIEPSLFELIRVCANSVCNHAPLTSLLKGCEISNDLMNGIVLSLQKPLDSIRERSLLKQEIEYQKEVLRKTKSSWHIFSKEKKTVEQEKSVVVQNMEKLDYLDNQIVQSHRMIADELAHFQRLNSKRLIHSIRTMAHDTLEIEKYKLNLLTQSSNKWDHFK
ncbi:unnamed protein product [Rhizopus stolonifer]